MFISNTYHWQQ